MNKVTSYGNINILDLRKAKPESMEAIKSIGNVNVVMFSRETAALLPHLPVGNMNFSMEIPADAEVKYLIGETRLNKAFFLNRETSFYQLVIGLVAIEADVTSEDLAKGLGGLCVIGQLVCPEQLAGVIQTNSRSVIGQTAFYPAYKTVLFDDFTLDEKFLNSLADATELAVVGSLKITPVLPEGLLERKIGRLYVAEGVTCHAENAQAVRLCLGDKLPEMTIIPAGFQWVDEPLVLDNNLLEALPGDQLYCTGRVLIDSQVTSALLDEHLKQITGKELILCPLGLKAVLSQKCNLLETQVVFYEGTLWLVEDEQLLRPSRFDYLEGNATLLVTGELTIDPTVEPRLLVERLIKVHNFGQITCTPDQMGAVEARLGIRKGELIDSTHVEAEKPEDEQLSHIGNVNYLVL